MKNSDLTFHETSPLRKSRAIRRGLAYGLLLVGFGLLLISTLGELSDLGDLPGAPGRSWELFDRALVDRTRNLDDLYEAARQRSGGDLRNLPPHESMQLLFTTVSARFTHGKTSHTPFSNWINWALGRVHPAFGSILNPSLLLKRGESAFCSEISSVLMYLAHKAGIRPRHVGLYGHVVMEAWYGGEWHMYDPDYEVVPMDESGYVLSVAALSKDEDMIRKIYAGRTEPEALVKIITSREDNSFVSYPPGSQFLWKAQVLLHIEQANEYLKFIIPVIIILLGILALPRRRSAKARNRGR